jgi:hypothetical protein
MAKAEASVQTLSKRHELVTTLFPRPATREDWARCRLSAEQVKVLRAEPVPLIAPAHLQHHLFYEFPE